MAPIDRTTAQETQKISVVHGAVRFVGLATSAEVGTSDRPDSGQADAWGVSLPGMLPDVRAQPLASIKTTPVPCALDQRQRVLNVDDTSGSAQRAIIFHARWRQDGFEDQ